MKKTIIASVMGIAASVAMLGTAQGQGFIVFGNYNYSTDAKVTHLIGGAPVDETYSAALRYFIGTTVNPNDMIDLAGSATLFHIPPTVPLGYFDGGAKTIPGYASGPITFQVIAYNGSGFNGVGTTEQGASSLFTLASIATGATPPGEFGAGLQAFTVAPIPEPSTFALIGLGTGALLFLRRRK